MRAVVPITSGSADEGGAGGGAGASTGDAGVGAAVVPEGALKNTEIRQGHFAGAIAFAAVFRSCTDGLEWSAWVKCIHAW